MRDLGVPDGSRRPADRRLGAGARLRRSLGRRALGGRPERRADPRRASIPATASTRSCSPDVTSRARACRCCSARGPRSAAGRVPGSSSRAPIRWRCVSCSRVSTCPDEGIDDRRLPLAGRAHAAPRLDEGARRALARRRELRDGADARLRLRDTGRRLGHRGLPRGRDTRDRGHGARRATCRHSSTGSSALLADEPRRVAMGAAARTLAERHYAWPDIAARLEGIYERVVAHRGAGRHARREGRLQRSTATPGCAGSRCSPRSWPRSSCSGGAGRSGTPSTTRSPSSAGAGCSSPSCSTCSRSSRARGRGTSRSTRRCRRRHRASGRSSRRSASACSGTPCSPRGPASSPASPSCAGTCPRAAAPGATLLGTVFAHRVFDVFPIALLVGYVAAHGEAAALGGHRRRRASAWSGSGC